MEAGSIELARVERIPPVNVVNQRGEPLTGLCRDCHFHFAGPQPRSGRSACGGPFAPLRSAACVSDDPLHAHSNSGPAAIVVTSVIITITVNSVGVMRPRCRPMLSM